MVMSYNSLNALYLYIEMNARPFIGCAVALLVPRFASLNFSKRSHAYYCGSLLAREGEKNTQDKSHTHDTTRQHLRVATT